MLSATQANKVKAIRDIWSFCDLIDFHGGSKNFATVHKKLMGFLTVPQVKETRSYSRRRLTLMPRGHLKSTVGTVLYVLWRIYRNPNIRILVGTNKLELSQAFIRELRQYLEDPELQERVWNKRPHIPGRLVPVMDSAGRKRRAKQNGEEETETEDKKLIWSLSAIQVLRSEKLKEPTVLATSVGTRVVGQHYDLLIEDDIVDFDNVSTPQKITKVFDWAQDMESVIDPPREVELGKVGSVTFKELVGDEILTHGTRYDDNDYYSYLLENAKNLKYKIFKRNIYKNGKDSSAGYIWSEKFTSEYVELLRARATPRRWASQYLNEIVAADDLILDYEKVRFFRSSDVEKKDNIVNLRIKDEKAKRVVKPYLVVDVAGSTNKTADNTVITVGGVDENHDVFVLDTKIGKHTPSGIIDLIYEMCDKWNLSTVHIETVGVGVTLPYNLKERFRSKRPLVINPIISKGEKKARLELRLQPLLENGKLFLPDWLAVNESVQNEFMMFPRATAKDDFLDTLDMLCNVALPTRAKASSRGVIRNRTYNTKFGGCR